MRKTIKIGAILVSMLALMFTGAFDWSDYETFEETFSKNLDGINRVVIENINGAINVTSGSANAVNIVVYEKIKENNLVEPSDLAAEVKLVSEIDGSTLRIKLDYGKYQQKHEGRHDNDYNKVRGYYQSNFEVTLPSRLSVGLDTVNGGITAPAFDGDINFETVNGSIKAGGTRGSANLETVNGSIDVEYVGKDADIETVNGDVTVGEAPGPVSVDLVNGDVEINIKGTLAGDISVDLTNGDVVLVTGANSGFKVKAETFNGKIYNKLSGFSGDTSRRNRWINGEVGNGQYKVSIDLLNGKITLK